MQIAVSGLKPEQAYRLWLGDIPNRPVRRKDELVIFKMNLSGAQIAQAIGPFRQVLTSKSEGTAVGAEQQFFLLTPADSEVVELIRKSP